MPELGSGVFVAASAAVIGQVRLGDEVSVWFGAVVRGDIGPIAIGARTNIQDHSVVHVTQGGRGVRIGDDVTVGHRAIIHECTIEDLALIGMGCVLLDGALIGRGAVVAAGAVVREGQVVPPLGLAAGAPAEVRKILPEKSLEERQAHARGYIELARRYLAGDVAALG